MNATYNAAMDYFGLGAATGNAFKLRSSAENRSIQHASGANTYGDAAVVDTYGETAAPSCEYEVVDEVEHDPETAGKTLVTLGTVSTPEGVGKPVVLGTLSISTQSGSAPSVSASGQMVQSGARQLRAYRLPKFTLLPRHRAQDLLGLMSIMKGAAAASDIDDYGYGSVNVNFPVAFTLSQPQGVTLAYDLHGDMATADYTMNWYAAEEPTIALTEAAEALGATMASKGSRADPANGYTQYTWRVSFPLRGEEVPEP